MTAQWKAALLAFVIIISCVVFPWTIIVWFFIGLWAWAMLRSRQTCPKCKGKMKRYVSVDFAARGSMAVVADCCVKCGHVVIPEVRDKPKCESAPKHVRNTIYGEVGTRPHTSELVPIEDFDLIKGITAGDRLMPPVERADGFYCINRTADNRCLTPENSLHRVCVGQGCIMKMDFRPLRAKPPEELVEAFYSARDNWTSGEPDPKADLTAMFKQSLPIFREHLINGFDPDGKVWSEEERREILEAPLVEEDFQPLIVPVSKATYEWLKSWEDE